MIVHTIAMFVRVFGFRATRMVHCVIMSGISFSVRALLRRHPIGFNRCLLHGIFGNFDVFRDMDFFDFFRRLFFSFFRRFFLVSLFVFEHLAATDWFSLSFSLGFFLLGLDEA